MGRGGAMTLGGTERLTLGRLERVDPRQAWASEPRDFTPWLASPENIALLGEAIGIELEVVSTERGVGPYRADILCKDTVSGHLVLVENQLEATDHVHMGQLMTYAAGLDAVTIVWVARRFTDEHRAALDWLNRITDPAVNFFGLEIELWRIGSSPVAPKFNVVSQPNDWRKTVKESVAAGQEGQASERQQLHREFWTQFREYMQQRGSRIRIGTPSDDYWKDMSIGRANVKLTAANGMRDGYSSVSFEMTGPQGQAHFQLLRERHREEVERVLGHGVHWDERPGRAVRKVELRRASKPADPSTWPELNAWFAEKLETMDGLFRPIVTTLDASKYETPRDIGDSGTGAVV
jgi:hypothetical protein